MPPTPALQSQPLICTGSFVSFPLKSAFPPHPQCLTCATVPHPTSLGLRQLFLFNYSTRQLHGVYVRDGPPAMNIEPQAWAHHRQVGANSMSSPYPAQVRWRELRACRAIREELWTQVPTRKGSSGKGGKPHYDMWMTGAQAQVLAELCIRHG